MGWQLKTDSTVQFTTDEQARRRLREVELSHSTSWATVELTSYFNPWTPPSPPPPSVTEAATARRLQIGRETYAAYLQATSESADDKTNRNKIVGGIYSRMQADGVAWDGLTAQEQGYLTANAQDWAASATYLAAYEAARDEINAIVADTVLTDDQKRTQIAAVTWSVA